MQMHNYFGGISLNEGAVLIGQWISQLVARLPELPGEARFGLDRQFVTRFIQSHVYKKQPTFYLVGYKWRIPDSTRPSFPVYRQRAKAGRVTHREGVSVFLLSWLLQFFC